MADTAQLNHSPLPYIVDTQKTEMGYGSGEGTVGQVTYYQLLDSTGRVVMDTSNSEVVEVLEEPDEDGVSAWDERGRRDMHFVKRACNTHYELLEALIACKTAMNAISENFSQNSIFVRALDNAFAIIAKAEGE